MFVKSFFWGYLLDPLRRGGSFSSVTLNESSRDTREGREHVLGSGNEIFRSLVLISLSVLNLRASTRASLLELSERLLGLEKVAVRVTETRLDGRDEFSLFSGSHRQVGQSRTSKVNNLALDGRTFGRVHVHRVELCEHVGELVDGGTELELGGVLGIQNLIVEGRVVVGGDLTNNGDDLFKDGNELGERLLLSRPSVVAKMENEFGTNRAVSKKSRCRRTARFRRSIDSKKSWLGSQRLVWQA